MRKDYLGFKQEGG